MSVASRLIVNRAGYVYLVLLDTQDAAVVFDPRNWSVAYHHDGDLHAVQRKVPRPGAPGKQLTIYLHRELFGFAPGECPDTKIDHKNGNILDNRRANLRLATNQQNMQNRKMHRNNTSGYVGVYYDKRGNNFRAIITIDGKHRSLGRFKTAMEASVVRDAKAREVFGEFYRAL
jgi:hypothetical protein